jgi:Phage tail tube protein
VLNSATPIRFNHASAVTVTLVSAPFTHVFSLLNPGSLTGSVTGQPPTHSFAHRNQVAGSGGYYADLYPYGCLSQIKLNGAASGLLTWSGNLTSWPQQAPASAFTIAPSSTRAIPAWKGTSTIAGSTISNVTTWGITLNRDLEPIPTVDGQQAPSAIARGGLTGQFNLTVNPAVDESILNDYLNNTQPTLLWTTSNGLSGASLVSFSVAAQLAGFNSAKLTAGKTVYGYNAAGDLVLNTTNAGQSGGYSPCQITLQNSIATY